MRQVETDPLCGNEGCGHTIGQHGDRAVTACLGGWNGHWEPGMTTTRCPCPGYKPGELRRRRWRPAA